MNNYLHIRLEDKREKNNTYLFMYCSDNNIEINPHL